MNGIPCQQTYKKSFCFDREYIFDTGQLKANQKPYSLCTLQLTNRARSSRRRSARARRSCTLTSATKPWPLVSSIVESHQVGLLSNLKILGLFFVHFPQTPSPYNIRLITNFFLWAFIELLDLLLIIFYAGVAPMKVLLLKPHSPYWLLPILMDPHPGQQAIQSFNRTYLNLHSLWLLSCFVYFILA